MNYRDRGSYARGVYLTQETAMVVKQEEETDTRMIARE